MCECVCVCVCTVCVCVCACACGCAFVSMFVVCATIECVQEGDSITNKQIALCTVAFSRLPDPWHVPHKWHPLIIFELPTPQPAHWAVWLGSDACALMNTELLTKWMLRKLAQSPPCGHVQKYQPISCPPTEHCSPSSPRVILWY